jgi:hypothetical protein
MRIESVTAHAFGPLVGKKLILAPGMTVIAGVNESAKSSWHAATYAALCGRRRGKGRVSVPEQRFADAHRPWHGSQWLVSAVLVLDDGRRIEIRQDLDGKVDCRATDVALNRDVSSEIMHDGSPDASVWLGLTRASFRATACVGQAQMLTVLTAADGLQAHLQQAAATASADGTAAEALNRLEAFHKSAVGRDITNSSRPLRTAIKAFDTGTKTLEAARAQHRNYLLLVEEADSCRAKVVVAEQQAAAAQSDAVACRDALEAAEQHSKLATAVTAADRASREARGELDRQQSRLTRVKQISARLGGRPAAGPSEHDELARTVAGALAGWEAAPSVAQLGGPSAATLAAELDALPAPPLHDRTPQPAVQRAMSGTDRAQAVLAEHDEHEPVEPAATSEVSSGLTAGAGVLRTLAADLASAAAPDADSDSDSDSDSDDRSSSRLEQTGHERTKALEQHTTARVQLAAARTTREQADAGQRQAAREADTEQGAEQVRDQEIRSEQAQLADRRQSATRRRTLALVGAGIGTVLTVVALIIGQVPLAVLLAVGAAGGGVFAARTTMTGPTAVPPQVSTAARRRLGDLNAHLTAVSEAERNATTAADDAAERLADADRKLGAAQGAHDIYLQARKEVLGRQAELAGRAHALGVPADPAELRQLATVVEQLNTRRQARQAWVGQRERLVAAADEAAVRLRSALRERQAAGTGTAAETVFESDLDVRAMLAGYESDCAAAAEQGTLSDSADRLRDRLDARQGAECAAAAAHEQRHAALSRLRAAGTAAAIGAQEQTPAADLVAALMNWQHQRGEQVAAAEKDAADRTERATLLDGSTVAELASAVEQLQLRRDNTRSAADTAAANAHDAAETARQHAVDAQLDPAHPLPALHRAAIAAQQHASAMSGLHLTAVAQAEHADGVRAERARSVTPVAEAEEALSTAEAELGRVRSLDHTLTLTEQFLSRAQERVHRDIAPILTETLTRWLPLVTEGRYLDARVDPQTLRVEICGPSRSFHPAELLSHGTAEQVYLLLRASLAQHLTAGHDSCPLLLDDVTVQADNQRTEQILELLHKLSGERQVVLFSQQRSVANWAHDNLYGPADQLVGLEQLPAL